MAILNMATNQNLHTTVQNYYDGKLLMEMEKQLVFYQGGQRKNLEVGKEPVVVFSLDDEKPIAVYAYCNLHGLWKKEI